VGGFKPETPPKRAGYVRLSPFNSAFEADWGNRCLTIKIDISNLLGEIPLSIFGRLQNTKEK